MRILIQRVKQAGVTINHSLKARIGKGYLLFVGFCKEDNQAIIEKMTDKILTLRIFEDENQKMNLNIQEVKGEILSISQFTLYADCQNGRRPSFSNAAPGEIATNLYHIFNTTIINKHGTIQTGEFGADMQIDLINDGPVTILLDSAQIIK